MRLPASGSNTMDNRVIRLETASPLELRLAFS